MPQWGNEIHFDEILTDVLNFFKEFPPCWWKMRPSDTLLRTIKTVVHSSVKIRGNAILQDLEKVQDYKNSEVESYILKQLKVITFLFYFFRLNNKKKNCSNQSWPLKNLDHQFIFL